MRVIKLGNGLVSVGLLTCLACSASSATPSDRTSGGRPSSTAGSSASGSTGNPTQPVGSGGTTGPVIEVPMDQGGRGMGCNDLEVIPKPVTPTVLILVDNSSSMFEPREQLWDLLFNSLMNPTEGVVKPLQEKVRFGFASYKGSTMITTEDSPTCAEIAKVDYALNNYDAINTTYTQLGTQWKQGTKWETPTGHAIQRVAADLAAYAPDPPGPKYILLVTDGNPNTCQVVDPQCGQDLSIKAVQDARAKGIGTFAVGIGDIVANNTGCEPAWGRCGVNHLQDLANAGQGLPVAAPPETFVWQSCADRYGRVLQGAYAAAGTAPGTAPYFTATNAAELKTALQGLLNSVVSCTFDMNARVVGNPALGSVSLGSDAVTFGDPNGWTLEPTMTQVTLQGTACSTFKAAEKPLSISFPCEVAVPR